MRYLITYVYTNDEINWKLFVQEINVPKGDGDARIALFNNQSDDLVKKGLKAGRNNEEDFDDMIWLFKNFRSVPFLARAIEEWTKGDALINELSKLGQEIRQKVTTSSLDDSKKKALLIKIGAISDKLTINEQNFSNTLAVGSRKIKAYLVFANVFFILVIISCVSVYFSAMMKKLLESAKEIEHKNKDLLLVNKELDNFVYSASHDLRSPLTSLKGLIEIAKEEKNSEQLQHYFELMSQSIAMQDQFISDIIDYSRNKRKESVREMVSLNKIIDEVLTQYRHLSETKTIKIKKKLEIDEIHSDGLRLKIILNNLVSNAIKYSDKEKTERIIEIRTSHENEFHKIVVKDNGIGIKNEVKPRIFEMFFGTNHNLGSGLGLYITKEAVEILNGEITVNSEMNEGTTFTVIVPNHYEA
ncbi:sensor histidine kinase [Flavobacterium enshiense]|uniref:sensor histidine kinase n=1 Tax=Flavobacterium enshiense TaxID=1341165 RepID=UPI00345DA2D0